jgi:uncharacterized protein (DUF2345 family)
VYAAKRDQFGASKERAIAAMFPPVGKLEEYFILKDPEGRPLKNHPYEITMGDRSMQAHTDEQGKTLVVKSDAPEPVQVEPLFDDSDCWLLKTQYHDSDTQYTLDFQKVTGEK